MDALNASTAEDPALQEAEKEAKENLGRGRPLGGRGNEENGDAALDANALSSCDLEIRAGPATLLDKEDVAALVLVSLLLVISLEEDDDCDLLLVPVGGSFGGAGLRGRGGMGSCTVPDLLLLLLGVLLLLAVDLAGRPLLAGIGVFGGWKLDRGILEGLLQSCCSELEAILPPLAGAGAPVVLALPFPPAATPPPVPGGCP